MAVSVFSSPADLKPIIQEWEEFARSASEPNVFYESWMLIPALELLRVPAPLIVVIRSDETDRLDGVFPLRRAFGYRGLPISYLTSYLHKHAVLGTPLVRSGFEKETIHAFLHWADTSSESGCMVELTQLGTDGPVYAALSAIITEEKRRVDELPYERALLLSNSNADSYIRGALSGKHLKDFRRLRNRLRDLGELTVTRIGSSDDINAWLQDFLDLERRGWKGESGTALAIHGEEREYFERICKEAFSKNQLHMLKLCLDGKPIAMKCSYTGGRGAFSLKIAYDEEYSRFSPGVLLELENIGEVLGDPNIDWMDSCAIPNHPMINRLWTERRKLCDMIISTERVSSKLITSGISRLRRVCRNRSLRSSFKRSIEHEQPKI